MKHLCFLRSIITKKKTYEIPVPHRVNFPDDPPESFFGPNFLRMKYIANPLIFGAPRDFAKVRKQSYPGLFPERHETPMKHLRNSLDFHQDTCHHPISWDRVPGHFFTINCSFGGPRNTKVFLRNSLVFAHPKG